MFITSTELQRVGIDRSTAKSIISKRREYGLESKSAMLRDNADNRICEMILVKVEDVISHFERYIEKYADDTGKRRYLSKWIEIIYILELYLKKN